jgi:hypothetical protein
MESQDNLLPMSDKEILDAATEDWTGVLASLWEIVGKPIDPARLRAYKKNLESVPLGLLELAINRVFRENVYQTVPVPGVIWEAIRKELHDPYDINKSLEEWQPPRTENEQMCPLEWLPECRRHLPIYD